VAVGGVTNIEEGGHDGMDRDAAIELLRGGEAGIAEWNRLRRAREEIPDLSEVNLSGCALRRANFNAARLDDARLSETDLCHATFSGARLRRADLTLADLHHTLFYNAALEGANLNQSNPYGATFTGSFLAGAQLGKSLFIDTSFIRTDFSAADLSESELWKVRFCDVDLSDVVGLETIKHRGPSTIGIDTLFRSKGKLPDVFLRGCGLSPWEVLSQQLYRRDLSPPGLSELQSRIFDAWTNGRFTLNGCFISYSWKDAGFVDKLRDRLLAEGINVWLDRHNMNAGTIQDQVWRAIQVHHVVIIVLSKNSVESDWVENELEMARKKEKEQGRAVLCPLSLDDAWKEMIAASDGPGHPSRQLWRTLQQKLILDFSGWDSPAFDEAFQKLVRGLKENYSPR
jgi:hypothetical protein